MPPTDPAGLATLYLVRHGESLVNAGMSHIWLPEGSPLSERGRVQTHLLAQRLSHVHADAVIASGLLRSRQTAEIIAQDRDLPVRIVPDLHERTLGSFAFRTDLRALEEYRARFEEYDRGTQEEKLRWKLAEEWESFAEAQCRFVRALEAVADDYPARTVIVVSHGTVMRTFLIHAGYGTLDQLPEGAIENTGYVVVETDGRAWSVVDTVGVSLSEPARTSRFE
jgi:broad specificity phosphatase PhoE